MTSIQLPSIFLIFPLVLMLLFGCSVPKEKSTEFIPAVKTFDIQRYLGTWYEIGRLPNSFERGLDTVTAQYSFRNDGTIAVLNKGFDTSAGKWKEAHGKARIKEPGTGALEVSFFWIFYADYKILELDTVNYSYAMVTSSSKEYLWILSRIPHIDDSIYNTLLQKASGWGFNISAIYKVSQ